MVQSYIKNVYLYFEHIVQSHYNTCPLLTTMIQHTPIEYSCSKFKRVTHKTQQPYMYATNITMLWTSQHEWGEPTTSYR